MLDLGYMTMEFSGEDGVVDLTVYGDEKGNLSFPVTSEDAAEIVFYLHSIYGSE